MIFSEKIQIGLCFNDESEAVSFSKNMNCEGIDVNYVISYNFDGFLKAIAALPKVDCFIIQDNFKECSAKDLIEKLKKSQRYKKSVIVLKCQDVKKIDKTFLELKLDYVFDAKTDFESICQNVKKTIVKKLTPVIPADFNVLVLDNSHEILEIISMHLNELGHQKLDLCHSIKDAKEKLSRENYDLLLLDWNLDDGTCIDLIEFIKKSAISARTKSALTMVITGRNDVDDIMTLLRYGVVDHIIKPFDFNEFEEKIGYAIEKHLKALPK